ncbi:ATP-binding cassette domain-containing protein, partial [Escherichia coli]|uniref:ATP-binding cassette domain-containing protein n=2 Tax=Gammaproteobacteria TaxID=1236 RepID=UPI0028DF17B6
RPVGERGQLLSGGQRQAVLMARAMLLDPPILLLDEPTSAMDNASEDTLRNRLHTWTQGKTLLLITHRASMLSLVDRLIVLDNGHVVA